jgi:phosphohistidine swiveling domain-containing protein
MAAERDFSDMTVKELEKEIENILEILPRDQHNDLFRAVVLMGQLDLAKFIYHDMKHNPITRFRNSKTKQAETIAFSQALVQLLLLMKVRNIDFPRTFSHAIEHMKDMDFAERKPDNHQEIKGQPVSGGRISGRAYVVSDSAPVNKAPEGSIIVIEHAEPEIAETILKSRAVVTDQGGKLCHMAILARENNFPAVIGTGNATSLIKTGDEIMVDADSGTVTKKQ